jgi:co-chaperonin GroES (HSP10)
MKETMNYTPQNNYIIVRKEAATTSTASGIILTTAQGADNAKVVAVAADITSVKEGDTLLIRWSNALKIDGDLYAVDFKEVVTKIW